MVGARCVCGVFPGRQCVQQLANALRCRRLKKDRGPRGRLSLATCQELFFIIFFFHKRKLYWVKSYQLLDSLIQKQTHFFENLIFIVKNKTKTHERVRRHAELIAMSQAQGFEHHSTAEKSDALFNQQQKLENISLILNLSVTLFDYFGAYLPYICLAPLVFGGHYSDKTESELSEIIGLCAFQMMYLVNQFTRLFDQLRNMGDLLACGKRLAEIYHSTSCKRHHNHDLSEDDGSPIIVHEQAVGDSRDESINQTKGPAFLSLQHVSINQCGSSRTLIPDLSIEMAQGDALLITGGNGLGKSTLFRACSGLWPVQHGRIDHRGKMMFAQETPALTDGTLAEQLIYPQLRSYNSEELFKVCFQVLLIVV